jgi:hypothetical protein
MALARDEKGLRRHDADFRTVPPLELESEGASLFELE